MWYEPLESQRTTRKSTLLRDYPAPMFMYHSWDSQNVWLRQIQAQNFMFMNAGQASAWPQGFRLDLGGVAQRQDRCQMKTMEAARKTPSDWNAIGKQGGAWGLKPEASEAKKGFLLNISSRTAAAKHGERRSHSDPVTGQAAWFDLRVKLWKAAPARRQLAEFPHSSPCHGIAANVGHPAL